MELTKKQQDSLKKAVELTNYDACKLHPAKLDLRTANSLVSKGLVEKRGYNFFVLTEEGFLERARLLNES